MAPTEKEIIDQSEAAMDEKLDQIADLTLGMCEIYAASMLYAYSKWLGMRHSTRNLVYEFLQIEENKE